MAFELKQEGFKLKLVLKVVDIPESTYHYHIKHMKKKDPDRKWKRLIRTIFYYHKENYGYRRIHLVLKTRGYHINKKKVQCLMQEMGLKSKKFTRRSRSKTYKGTVGKVAKNKLNRRFDTHIPLQKLVTDMTEFKCKGDKKLYLHPLMDLYNGEIIAFGMSHRPTLAIALDPLGEALEVMKDRAKYRTTIHSDQGWHYQHNNWVKTLKKHKVFQSMSRKGTCADNAVMENFFGILKQEMYHGEALLSYEELKIKIEEYIYYYNHERIKGKLGGLSPVQYRIQTHLITG